MKEGTTKLSVKRKELIKYEQKTTGLNRSPPAE